MTAKGREQTRTIRFDVARGQGTGRRARARDAPRKLRLQAHTAAGVTGVYVGRRLRGVLTFAVSKYGVIVIVEGV